MYISEVNHSAPEMANRKRSGSPNVKEVCLRQGESELPLAIHVLYGTCVIIINLWSIDPTGSNTVGSSFRALHGPGPGAIACFNPGWASVPSTTFHRSQTTLARKVSLVLNHTETFL